MSIKIPIVTVFDNKGLKNAQAAIGKVGSGIKGAFKFAAGATAAVAALTTLGVGFAKAAEQAKVANNRLDQVAKSMGIFGSDTQKVTDRLKAYADTNMLVMGIDDEVIKSTQAKLLTFKELAATADVAGGSFDRATQAAFDLAAAGFGSAETNATQLGKALQDPIKGLTALTRSGVTFTQAEREKIRTLVESGNTLQAQEMILSAIENQVGGTAAATATASQKMSVAFGEMSESLGTAILPAFEQLTQVVMSSFVPAVNALTPIFTNLFAALIPIIEKALPVFIQILEALTPIVITLLKALEPIFDALMPLVDVFLKLVAAIAPVIEQAMPILIRLVEMLAPIIVKLVEAFIPLIEKLLPPLLKLFEAILPVLEIFIDLLIRYILPAFLKLIDVALPPLIFLIENLTKGFQNLEAFLSPVYQAIKPILDSLLAIAGIKPGDLQKTVTVTTKVSSDVMDSERRRDAAMAARGAKPSDIVGSILDTTTIKSGAAKTTKAQSPLQALIAGSKKDEKVLSKTNQLIGKNLSKDVAQWITSSSKPVAAANQALKRISKNGEKAVKNLTRAYQNSAAGQAAAAAAIAKADADAQAEKDKRDQEAAEKLAQQEATYKSFADSIVNVFASIKDAIVGAFSLPELGGSTDSIIRNMDKLLARVRAFSTNISQLSSMGLNPTLLAQVIQAGPVAGARLAANLVAGGAEGLARINTGFGEIQTLGSEIGMTGTQAQFGTPRQQQIINVNINGGLDSSASIGKAVVDAVRAYERTSGAVWQGA